MVNKIIALGSAALLAAVAVSSASAQTVTFNTTGNDVDHGDYGNSIYFPSSTLAGALQLKVTGYQSNQSNNNITTAYVGAYSPGLGVTGVGDFNGDYNYHQIDNAGGYTDFLLLQFSAPVALSSLNLNSFTLGSASAKDNDFAFYAASIPEAAWNSTLPLTNYQTVPSLWTTIAGNGSNGSISTGSTVLSREFLVGAAFNSGNNDGFKIASITVAPAVPEPATWAMMIVGFGAVGFALRSARRQADHKFDTKIKRITYGKA